MAQKYTVGQKVTGSINQLLSYGLFVELGDGAKAYIRRRELAWDSTIDPRDYWQVGQLIDGNVIKLPETDNQLLELSHRTILPNPWCEQAHNLIVGEVVQGTVKSILSHGIYVELYPGVNGFVPLVELSTQPIPQPEAVVWPSDNIEAIITYVNIESKKLTLSIRARLRQLKRVASIIDRLTDYLSAPPSTIPPTEKESLHLSITERPETEIEPSLIKFPNNKEIKAQIGPILVIDDYDQLRTPLTTWLQDQGFEAEQAHSAEVALAKLETKLYQTCLVDLNLPGMDGMTLIKHIRANSKHCHIIVMSATDRLTDMLPVMQQFNVLDAITKPLDLPNLIDCLLSISQPDGPRNWSKSAKQTSVKSALPIAFQTLTNVAYSADTLPNKLKLSLEQIATDCQAELGLIFHIDPISRNVSITASIGSLNINKQALPSLILSPVKDIMVDGEPILEQEMGGNIRNRFKKLLDFVSFNSCLGASIQTLKGTNHVLFLFHRTIGMFNRYHLRDTLAATMVLATTIERNDMAQQLQLANKQILNGQLANGFGHEVYNKMSGLEIQLQNLGRNWKHISQGSEKPTIPTISSKMSKSIDTLYETYLDLRKTVSLFQQLMQVDRLTQVNLNTAIEKSIALLLPTFNEQSITIEFEPDLRTPTVRGDTIQLQQVFLNLILNASQHFLAEGVKTVSITITYEPDQADIVMLHFSDTGVGIHKQLWHKIFELGFTRRPGGTGQGLHLARTLVESMGGTIVVENSVMFVGSTFLIKLPSIIQMEQKYA